MPFPIPITTYVAQLPTHTQRHIGTTLLARGLDREDVLAALDSRLCDLEDTLPLDHLETLLSVPKGCTLVFLSSEETCNPLLALQAVYVSAEKWNGFLQPSATADAFGRFLAAWHEHRPDANFGEFRVTDDGLLYRHATETWEDAELFPFDGTTDDDVPVYLLSGWQWV
jgi:hypothetical protein